MHEALQRVGELLLQALDLEELPLIEAGTIMKREPVQEITAVDLDRLGQQFQTIGTYMRLVVAVQETRAQKFSETVDIQPEIGRRFQTNRIPIDIEVITC